MKRPHPQHVPLLDDAPSHHWYWDSLGHEWGPWHCLHNLGDIVTQSRRRFVYFTRCDDEVKDRLVLINAQAIHDREDAIDHARGCHPRGNRHVSAAVRIEELFAEAGEIVVEARRVIDEIVAEHLNDLSKADQACNEAAFNAAVERERFAGAHAKFRHGQPLAVPEFLRRRKTARRTH